MNSRICLYLCLSALTFTQAIGQKAAFPKNNPAELGKVSWLRNYDEALAVAVQKNLPVLILFQEVPGCSNCTRFGHQVLSHPLIVEAIETCFVPLCIYNNKTGHDADVLKKYHEPAWNNPVVRIVDNKGADLVPRQPNFASMAATVTTINQGILKAGREVPGYMALLQTETESAESGHVSEAYFSMYCFWSGEKEIGGIDGVLATEAGFMHGKEVVRVTYRDDKVKLADLYTRAKSRGCADDVYGPINKDNKIAVKPSGHYRKDEQDKYYVHGSPYRYVPMTELQKTRVNRALGTGRNPGEFLSPRQLAWLTSGSKTDCLSENIEKIWWKN